MIITMNIAVISLGCPKNQADADVMLHALLAAGHTTTPLAEQADCILINTCGFIESAKQEAIEHILQACSLKQQRADVKVVVTGCLAERYRHEIVTEIPEVDAVVGMAGNQQIVQIIGELVGNACTSPIERYGAKEDAALGGARVVSTPQHYAYLKIAEGCNHRCTYCAIPMIRGRLRSRTIEDLVAEAHFLAQQGVRELILVAQDLTAFGEDRGAPEIVPLLDALNEVEGICWIRLMYAYPERITDDFIQAMLRNEKVVHYLDMPIQHIDSDVLRAMNRQGNEQTVRTALEKLRAAMPDIALRTTLIAGFPGETEQQFEKLCAFVREQRFDRLGCFAYSEEEGTKAALLPQLPPELREQRAQAVMRAQADVMAALQAKRVGQTIQVLCDEYDAEQNVYFCRSVKDAPEIDAVVAVAAQTALYPGMFYTVRIYDSDVYDLYAELAEEEGR